MYEMLCAYAKKECINEGKPFKKPAEEKTKPDADSEK